MRSRWDHPRRCGENLGAAEISVQTEGSPPQVRGKLPLLTVLGSDKRITPAGAGKTPSHGVSARS